MDTTKITEAINQPRRYFVGAAAVTAAAAQLGIVGSAAAQTTARQLPSVTPGTHTSFGPLKQIDAGVLSVAYAEAGPPDGSPVILLHGWPYDIYSFVDVAPLLASAGYRVIVPYLRGYGATRFLSSDTVRNGQPSAIASRRGCLHGCPQDRRRRFSPASTGGANREHRLCALARAVHRNRIRERLSHRQPGSGQDAPPSRGGIAMVVSILFCHRARAPRIRKIPARLSRLIWQLASPKWKFDDATFNRTARRHSTIPTTSHMVIHNYRWRLGLAEGESKYDDLESGLPKLRSSRCPPLRSKATQTVRLTRAKCLREKFSGRYEHRTITGGIGHNLPQEAPQALCSSGCRCRQRVDQRQGL